MGFASKIRGGKNLRSILGTAMGMQTSLANQGTGDVYKSPNPETKKPGFHSADASADGQVREQGKGSPRAQAIRAKLADRRSRGKGKKKGHFKQQERK